MTKTSRMSYLHGLVYTALSAFGGGIIVPLLVGHNDYYPFPLKDEFAVPILILAYSSNRWLPFLRKVISIPLIQLVLILAFECARCFMALNWLKVAVETIPASRFKVPVVGPLICGTIGSCGGAFLPFEKGLKAIEDGVTYWILSGFTVMWLYLGTVHVAPIYHPTYTLTDTQAHGVCVLLLMFVQVLSFVYESIGNHHMRGVRKTWQSKLNRWVKGTRHKRKGD